MSAGGKSFWKSALILLRQGPFRRYIAGAAISDTGTWMKHGPDMIHLQGLKDQPTMYMQTDSSLIQLDMSGKRIEGKLAEKYILKRLK